MLGRSTDSHARSIRRSLLPPHAEVTTRSGKGRQRASGGRGKGGWGGGTRRFGEIREGAHEPSACANERSGDHKECRREEMHRMLPDGSITSGRLPKP